MRPGRDKTYDKKKNKQGIITLRKENNSTTLPAGLSFKMSNI
jgi:hypothetical protein